MDDNEIIITFNGKSYKKVKDNEQSCQDSGCCFAQKDGPCQAPSADCFHGCTEFHWESVELRNNNIDSVHDELNKLKTLLAGMCDLYDNIAAAVPLATALLKTDYRYVSAMKYLSENNQGE